MPDSKPRVKKAVFNLSHTVNQGFRLARVRFKQWHRATSRRLVPLRDFSFELIRSPRQIGAICPSSKSLARAMADGLDSQDDRLVVELGAGTGNITQALLEKIPLQRLLIIEYSKNLVCRLKRRFPEAQIINGNAVELSNLIGDQIVGTVVSSLPLRSLEAKTAELIIMSMLNILDQPGRIIQFTYDLRKPSIPLQPGLRLIHSQRIWSNLPPARVDVFDYSR